MKDNYSKEEYGKIEERARTLAQEKSSLQLIIKMMNKLGELPGLENTLNTLIQLLIESIGGTNVTVYYSIDNDVYMSDINKVNAKIERIIDENVKTVFESKEFLEISGDFESTKLLTNQFTEAYTWVCPLLAGNELIGVIKIDDLHIASREFKIELPTFFNYVAIVIKNEILGYTKLKKAFDRLGISENRYKNLSNQLEAILDHIPGLVFYKDTKNNFIRVNKYVAGAYKKNKEELEGKNLAELYPEDVAEKYYQDDLAVINSGSAKLNIVEPWDTAEGMKWVNTSKIPFVDDAGDTIGIIGISMEITELKQAQDEIVLKNKQLIKLNSEKDKFFSIIAHDLRSPFTGFLGLTEVMAEGLPGMTLAQIQNIAVNVRNSASNLYRLLGDLLDWSLMQRGLTAFEPRIILLMQIISDSMTAVQESAANKGIVINYGVPEELTVFADGNMLGGIIRNLVSNAVKFTPKGGKITVTARKLPDKPVEISVRDTGIGMDKNLIDNLFRLDVNTSRKGTADEPSTGLGLIICRDFIEKHGGKLRVESEEGNGSVFSFTIP